MNALGSQMFARILTSVEGEISGSRLSTAMISWVETSWVKSQLQLQLPDVQTGTCQLFTYLRITFFSDGQRCLYLLLRVVVHGECGRGGRSSIPSAGGSHCSDGGGVGHPQDGYILKLQVVWVLVACIGDPHLQVSL